MSELINTTPNRNALRRQLFTTVSSLALVLSAGNAALAHNDDESRPTVWIELGAQLERLDTAQSAFAPAFATKTPTPEPFKVASPLLAQRPARYAIGGEGKITFAPEGSDWVFSAGVRYGRASSKRNIQHQSAFTTDFPNPKYVISPVVYPTKLLPVTAARLSFNKTRNLDTHAILDFQAGRDVGLGFHGSSSVISAGVRFASFDTSSEVRVTARPTALVSKFSLVPLGLPGAYAPFTKHNEFNLNGSASRSFHGIGPSLAWNASVPFLGTADEGEIAFDWGLNAAVLFGRQKASGNHHTMGTHYTAAIIGYPVHTPLYPTKSGSFNRTRSVVVPNAGAFGGLSFRYSDAKVSFGYRADYFFGAMDVGTDTRKTSTRGFHGPFAKISVGLGG